MLSSKFLHAFRLGAIFATACVVQAPSVHAQVNLIVGSCQHADSCGLGGPGDSDGQVDPGESVSLLVVLRNIGSADASGVTTTVTALTAGVTMTQAVSTFGAIPAFGAGIGIPAAAYTVDASVACGTALLFDVAIASDQGSFAGSCNVSVPASCLPCANTPADLSIQACDHADACPLGGIGSGDGEVAPGESVSLQLTLANAGREDATSVSALASTSTPGVTITQAATAFGTIPGFGSGAGSPAITYDVATSVPCGTPIRLDVAISSDQGTFIDLCSVTVPAACTACAPTPASLSIGTCSTTDDCALGGPGDGNGDMEPGESGATMLIAANAGGTTATNVTAVVSTSTPGVTVTQPNVSFGSVSSFGMAPGNPAAGFTVDASVPCGTDIALDVRFSSDQGPFTDSCVVSVPAPCTTCAATPPSLSVGTCSHSDACAFGGPGDANSSVDPGESGSMVLVVENAGGSAATGVSALVSCATPGVIVNQPGVTVGVVPAFGSSPGFPTVDYTVDVGVPCGTDIVFTVDMTSDQGPTTGSCTVTVPATCTPCTDAPVLLTIQSCAATDECPLGGPGDGDGEVAPGETARVFMAVRNFGGVNATGVSAIVTSPTPGVTIVQGSTTFGVVPRGGVGVGTPAIELSVAGSVACGTDIVLDVAFSTDQGPQGGSCNIAIPLACSPCVPTPAVLSVASCAATDSCALGGSGDGNGAVEPGESATIVLSAANSGSIDATNVTATVTTASPGVTLLGGAVSFGTVPGLGTRAGATTVSLDVDPAFACGTDIVLDVRFVSDQGTFTDSCSLVVPVACELCAPSTGYRLAHVASTVLLDLCSSGGSGSLNGVVDPGETVRLASRILNQGPADATAVLGTLVSLTPGVTVTIAGASYGDIASGGSADAAIPYEFSTDPLVVGCGDPLAFRIDFSSGEGQPSPIGVGGLVVVSPCVPCAGGGPPGEVPWIVTRRGVANALVVDWQPAPFADVHDVHQGTMAGLGAPGPWDHACIAKDLVPPLTTVVPGTTCGDGLDLYFLVVGRNVNGTGPFGYSDVGGGQQRDSGAACP